MEPGVDMQIWRVNMRTRTFQIEAVPDSWNKTGGRGLISRILLDEVDPGCEPLGSGNKLVFAPGLLVGHMLSSTDRISIGAKSPLTGGIKESNAGGRTGLQLAQLGIKALVIEDRPLIPDSGSYISAPLACVSSQPVIWWEKEYSVSPLRCSNATGIKSASP